MCYTRELRLNVSKAGQVSVRDVMEMDRVLSILKEKLS